MSRTRASGWQPGILRIRACRDPQAHEGRSWRAMAFQTGSLHRAQEGVWFRISANGVGHAGIYRPHVFGGDCAQPPFPRTQQDETFINDVCVGVVHPDAQALGRCQWQRQTSEEDASGAKAHPAARRGPVGKRRGRGRSTCQSHAELRPVRSFFATPPPRLIIARCLLYLWSRRGRRGLDEGAGSPAP